MLLEEIRNIRTVRNIQQFNIDVSQFRDLKELRLYIHKQKLRVYSRTHKEYFRDKMRQQLENEEFRKQQYERVRLLNEKKKALSPPRRRGRPRIVATTDS